MNKLGFIPNEVCNSPADVKSEKLREEISAWKDLQVKSKASAIQKMSYWKVASNCTAL